MEYKKKKKKGIDKVERMNRFFDRTLLPAIGILIILLLASFTFRRFREKFGSDLPSASSTVRQTEPEIFALRRNVLAGYEQHKEQFEAYGYHPVDGYSYDLSLCKAVDSEMSIFQFSDDSLGQLTILNYLPKDRQSPYDSLSMGISSYRLITVTAKRGEDSHSVTFLSYDFTSYQSDSEEEYRALMKLTDSGELASLYEIFETDIRNLAAAFE